MFFSKNVQKISGEWIFSEFHIFFMRKLCFKKKKNSEAVVKKIKRKYKRNII